MSARFRPEHKEMSRKEGLGLIKLTLNFGHLPEALQPKSFRGLREATLEGVVSAKVFAMAWKIFAMTYEPAEGPANDNE